MAENNEIITVQVMIEIPKGSRNKYEYDDEKILCVPINDPLWNHIQTLKEAPPHLLKEIEHFFRVYKDLEEKKTGVEGWVDDLEATLRVIKESQVRYSG